MDIRRQSGTPWLTMLGEKWPPPIDVSGSEREDNNLVPVQQASKEGLIKLMVYVVKWIPEDQGVTIDRTKRYDNPAEAVEFACNALQLRPKKIWIEDEKGVLHTDHQAILEHDRKRREDGPYP
jgi:hypothetical protein